MNSYYINTSKLRAATGGKTIMKRVTITLCILIIPLSYVAYRDNSGYADTIRFTNEFLRQALKGL